MKRALLFCYELDIRIEHVHEQGFVHCDIKPRNFVFGAGKNAGRLHLIDFGLSRPWIDPKTGTLFAEEPSFGFRGAPLYASRQVHLHHALSRRDDMKSLAGRTLCEGYDDVPVFAQFVDYARSLQYDETPRYEHWRRAFCELIPGLPEDASFDPDDDSEPRVGVQKNVDRLRCEDCPKRAKSRSDSNPFLERILGADSRSSQGGRHSFVPNVGSSWGCGGTIAVGDLFGDEFAIVEASLEFIDAPPDYIYGSCTYPGAAPPEQMKNTQSDTRCI
ncbi:kinase-like domain-containing protein [Ganoderma leucocontextum]|nr:kinase-like domain-containing protein [Ganoderma leucocontextum]